jgi:mannose-6-phosphate isomerase-like protein (cupin superfamily)
VWSGLRSPFRANNTGGADEGLRNVGTTLKNGTVFRIIEFAPGVAPRNHRTDSIDYAVVVSGEIDMEIQDSVVHRKAGDVLVQRGTIHNWANRGTKRCVMAFCSYTRQASRGRREGPECRRVIRLVKQKRDYGS